MLSKETLNAIYSETVAYWNAEVKKPEILSIAQGKEIGHKLADLVDEKTTALLTLNHVIKFQRKDNGATRPRSMGDMWLLEGGLYHPINVKTGMADAAGQPNLVSLKKTLMALMSRQIDSYYLLFVKMQVNTSGIVPRVYLADMLDWLDYVTCDSGPGQLMLKESKFSADYATYRPKKLGTAEKVKRLMAMYEDSEKRLIENREADRNEFRDRFEKYLNNEDFSVTPDTQATLGLQ